MVSLVARCLARSLILYHHPKLVGVEITPAMAKELAMHQRMIGLKASSGFAELLGAYRAAVPLSKWLFAGDETLLVQALDAGWNGTISGASNVLAPYMTHYLAMPTAAGWDRLQRAIQAVRAKPQPETNRAMLHGWGLLSSPVPRLPLVLGDSHLLQQELEELLGTRADRPPFLSPVG